MKISIRIEDDDLDLPVIVEHNLHNPSEKLVGRVAAVAWREVRALKRISEADGGWEVIVIAADPDRHEEMLRVLRDASRGLLTLGEARDRIMAVPGCILRTENEWLAGEIQRTRQDVGATVAVRRSHPTAVSGEAK